MSKKVFYTHESWMPLILKLVNALQVLVCRQCIWRIWRHESSATCISHMFSHDATSRRWFLWAALEAIPNTVHIFTRQWRRTRIIGFENAPFMLECLVLCVNGCSYSWLRENLCAKCTLQTCYWLLSSPAAEQSNSFSVGGSHFQY